MPDLFAPALGEASVKLSSELIRVLRLPRRIWTPEDAEHLALELTEVLRTPTGTMRLRPLQAIALYEMGTEGGAFIPLPVGAGKTLISMLAPNVMFKDRPALLIPAKLRDKTYRDFEILSKHWRITHFLRTMTYEWLGRVQAAEALEELHLDLVIGDEGHKLRNLQAAVTRRVRRFFAAHPEVAFVVMSGTMTKRSLHDYWHLMRWVYTDQSKMPMPREYQDLELWADALDERKEQKRRADPGMLKALCNDEEKELWKTEKKKAARVAFRRRLRETSGVIAAEHMSIGTTLTINAIEPEVPKVIDEAFDKLRDEWELPDGHSLIDGLSVFQHARELALGFFYFWDPRPPKDWMEARKAWSAFVRRVLKGSRSLDSELQVRRAHPQQKELLDWLKIKDTFEPNTQPAWLSDFALKLAAEWAEKEKGIIWCEHVVFGEKLASDFGLSYYGRGGVTAAGASIDDHKPGTPLAASIQSNSEGRNLQAWSTNLITSTPANGKQWEQLLGRTHRDGQEEDEVSADVLVVCAEHVGAFWQAVRDSEYVEESTGAPQKLLVAGKNVPTTGDVMFRKEKRWVKWT